MAVAIDTANQGRVAASVNGTTTFTTLAAIPSGGTLVVFMGIFRATATTHTVSGGGLTWNQVGSTIVSGSLRVSMWYAHCPSGLASGTTITCGGSAGTNDITAVATSYTGVATTSTITAFGNSSGSGTGWGGASVAANNGDTIIGGAWGDGTLRTSTPTSPALERQDFNSATTSGSNTLVDEIGVTGTDSVAGTWSGTLSHLHFAGAFAAAAGGGTTHERSAAIAATGDITVANREFFTVFTRQATIDAAALLTVTAYQRDHQRQTALTATGSVTVSDFERDHHRQTAAAATSDISVSGEIEPPGATTHERSASLDATSAITVSGTFWTTFERATATDSTGTVTVTDHERDHHRQATQTAVAAVTVNGEIEGAHQRAATIDASAAIQVAYQRVHTRQATIAATGTATVAHQRHLLRQATLTAAGLITAAGVVNTTLTRTLALTATALITADGDIGARRWYLDDPVTRWPPDTDTRWPATTGTRWS